jgi:hypothetical protein
MKVRSCLPGFFAALIFAVAMNGAASARANGVAQIVKLTYIEGLSNFGPTDGEGALEFSFAEAFARVEVKNLKPIAGFTYEGWLMGGAGKPFFVATIPVQASGVGTIETKLEGLTNYDYDTFVVAARAETAAPGVLPTQKNIAGRFTLIADPRSGSTPGDVRPQQLPDAGEAAPGTDWTRITRTALIAGGAALAAFGILRAVRRRAVK